MVASIPFTNELGLRDYRVSADPATRPIAWLILLAFLFGLALGARLTAASRIDAKVSSTKDRVTLQVHLKPSADDRAIHAVLDDGETFFRMSSQLTDRDRTLYPFEWYDVPRGEYQIAAFVTGSTNQPLCSTRTGVIVAGRE